MTDSGVYQIRNRRSGKCYIGSSVNLKKRRVRHLSDLRRGQHPNVHLQAAFAKYGQDAFEFSVLENVARERLIECEQHYLDTLQPEYNSAPTAGTSLGCQRSPETRKKIRKARLGQRHSAEARRKMREVRSGEGGGFYGKHHSEETRAKMSAAASGERNPNYGKSPRQETRRKLSEALKAYQYQRRKKAVKV